MHGRDHGPTRFSQRRPCRGHGLGGGAGRGSRADGIFNVHFRNIRGGYLNFRETFPDDGDVDMLRALGVYKEVGYDGMIMPDHVPQIDGDAGGAQAFAFAFGYIQTLLRVVNGEA